MSDWLPWGLLSVARLAPFLLITPWLEPIARTLRAPLLLVFGACSLAVPKTELPDQLDDWAFLAAAEFFLGMVLAISFALPFYVFRWLGDLAETLRGAPRSQMSGTQSDTALSFFFHLASLAVFAAIGGFVMTIDALHQYSLRYPLGQPWPNEPLALNGALLLLTDAFRLVVHVGAPVLATALLLEIALALIARTAPQIPVFFLALPVRSLAVLSVAAIGLGTTLVVAADVIGNALTLR